MTIAPDQGMAGLFPERFAPPAAPGPGPALEGELDIGARLVLALDGMTAAARQLAAARQRSRLSWEECHLIDIPPAQSSAAGTIDQPDEWGPQAQWVWQILALPFTLGTGTSAAALYRDAATPVNLVLSQSTSGIFEPKGLFLMPGRRLLWASTGGGLTVCAGIAVEIAIDSLPAYLL